MIVIVVVLRDGERGRRDGLVALLLWLLEQVHCRVKRTHQALVLLSRAQQVQIEINCRHRLDDLPERCLLLQWCQVGLHDCTTQRIVLLQVLHQVTRCHNMMLLQEAHTQIGLQTFCELKRRSLLLLEPSQHLVELALLTSLFLGFSRGLLISDGFLGSRLNHGGVLADQGR